MQKITEIKSVDFKVIAKGHGVVNWNGPTTVKGDDGKEINNHTMPKLKGYNNLTGKYKEETGYQYKKTASDIDLKKNPLYISQNCIRHHLFKEQAYDLHFANNSNIDEVIASITGLLRGFVVPATQNKRTSPLLIEDFVDQLGNGNFEQMGKSGSKEKTENKKGEDKSNSIFSKTTFGDTEYIAYGSISIEQLQFISLDNKFDRASMVLKKGQGEIVATKITDFIKTLANEQQQGLQPQAVFAENYVRQGTIFNEGEDGILLNNDALKILVTEMLRRIENLVIRQAKGYMYVDSIAVDYNNSDKMMRIKREPDTEKKEITAEDKFAVYFESKPRQTTK
jgi:hypothetical protein